MARPGAVTLQPPAAADDKRQRVLDAALKRTGYQQNALIEVLHSAQNTFGYLTPELLWYVAGQLRLPPSRVYGVGDTLTPSAAQAATRAVRLLDRRLAALP
jgi:NADH:ubiquinone oxidoreductase subunit E